MAFRLKDDAPAADGLSRVVRKQFDAAVAALARRTPDQEAVHAARRSVKRIRAVMRLLRGQLGPAGARAGQELRAIAHALASLRDADATAETLAVLHGRYPVVVDDRVTRGIARGLGASKQRARKAAGLLARRASTGLCRLRRLLPGLVQRAGDLRAIRSGMAAGYRRARRKLREISPDSDATQFHAWRRRLKDHAYQVHLLEGLHATPRARVRSLDRLVDWLGEDHDHAMLRAALLASPERFGAAGATAAVLGSIVKRQARLRRSALGLGRRLFSAKPRSFRKKVGAWLPRESRR
jgi:CHAD domain-containing protein